MSHLAIIPRKPTLELMRAFDVTYSFRHDILFKGHDFLFQNFYTKVTGPWPIRGAYLTLSQEK